jgi:hypothetical protein
VAVLRAVSEGVSEGVWRTSEPWTYQLATPRAMALLSLRSLLQARGLIAISAICVRPRAHTTPSTIVPSIAGPVWRVTR